MEPLKVKKEGPSESKLQEHLMKELMFDEWCCIRTHGNAHQKGFPDVFAASMRYGTRWIEMKRPGHERFTSAQLWAFTQFSKAKVGVWVLNDGSHFERQKLFGPSNWYTYLFTSRGIDLKPIERRERTGPEGRIQNQLHAKLTARGWFVLETYGSVYQSGLPDMYACHPEHGAKWIEVKNIEGYTFTGAQRRVFPLLGAHQVGIWILCSATDSEIDKLKQPPNWHTYFWK